MAKAPAAVKAQPPVPNRERPDEPKLYEASTEELLEFYKQMLMIRRFEEKAGQLYGLGFIGGFCHLYIGQEAVAVGGGGAIVVTILWTYLFPSIRNAKTFDPPKSPQDSRDLELEATP